MRPMLHRGKAPAPGILYVPVREPAYFKTDSKGESTLVKDPSGYFLGEHISDKPPSRRDRHRAAVAAARVHLSKRPDFSAQITAEAKAERGRKARKRRAGLR